MVTGVKIEGLEPLWVLDDLLTKKECEYLISKANATTTTGDHQKSWHSPGTGGKYSRVITVDRSFMGEN